MNALVPGIGRFYTRGLNSASELESEAVSINPAEMCRKESVQLGLRAHLWLHSTQSPRLLASPGLSSFVSTSSGPHPLRTNGDRSSISHTGYITTFRHLHSMDF